MRTNNANLTQKRERKKVEYFQSYDRKTIFSHPLGQVAPSFNQNQKTSSTIYFFLKYEHNAKEILKKYSLELELQPIENWRPS
jgi:hypothetical protein